MSKAALAALALGLSQSPVMEAQGTNATPATSKNRIETSYSLNPRLPIPLIATMAGLYTLACAAAARGRMRGAWLRTAAGGVITMALLNPEKLTEEREILPTDVAVVVDKSTSQSLGGRADMTARAQAELVKKLSALEGVNVHTIDAAEDPGSPYDGTPLFSRLDGALSEIPRNRLGAVIMLTDGQVHDVPGSHPALENKTPLHALISGRPDEKDRRIVVDQAPRYGLVGKEQILRFRITDDGSTTPATATVDILIDGKAAGTKTVKTGELTETKITMAHAGPNIVELRTTPLPGELTDINNRIVTPIEGIRESLAVLLITGSPSPGVRMWRDLLKSDPDTDVVHFMLMRLPDAEDNTPYEELALTPFPMEEVFGNRIKKFGLIIFDHYNDTGVLPPNYIENIANHVKDGGALLVISGPEYATSESLKNSPLAAVLPAQPSGEVRENLFRPRLTDDGKKHPVTRNLESDTDKQTWGRWLRAVGTAGAPEGKVLMQSDNGRDPLLILHRKDKGRVAMVQSDSTWMWARGFEGGGPYAPLLRQVSGWLMKNPDMEEEALRLVRAGEKIVVEQQTMQTVNVPVTVITPSGKKTAVKMEQSAPGLWRGSVPADEFGLYNAEQSGAHPAKAFVNVGPENPKEFSNTLSTAEKLKPLTDASGGTANRMTDGRGNLAVPTPVLFDPADKNEKHNIRPGEIGIKVSSESLLKNFDRTPVVPPWLALALTMGMMAAAWWRESESTLKDLRRSLPFGKPGPS